MAASLLGASLFVLSGCATLLDGPATRREALTEARFPPGGQFVTISGGRRVHAVVAGQGPDLVLIHGASGNTRDFTFDLVGRLTDRYRVIVFDRPGLGYTDRASDLYGGLDNPLAESPQEQAAMLKEAADALGAARPVVLGQSYGGAVALAWGLDHDPAALVLVSPISHPWPSGSLGPLYDFGASPKGGAVLAPLATVLANRSLIGVFARTIFDPQPVPEGYLDYMGAELSVRREALLANGRQVATVHPHLGAMQPQYPTLDLPVEVVVGDSDRIVPWKDHSLKLRRDIPGAHLRVLPGVGHMPHHADPQAVIEAIDRAATRAGLR